MNVALIIALGNELGTKASLWYRIEKSLRPTGFAYIYQAPIL